MRVSSGIQTVHLVFKTHLDVGFTDLAHNVLERYFTIYLPRAMEVARRLRESGSADRLVWTTGAWLIYEYLEQATPPERQRMEAAIAAGDLAWHGLPFTTHSELMDVGLFKFGLSLAQTLDRRFGKKTIAAKMTDVPGHTRSIVPLLAQAGIQFLHLGVNPAVTPPDVPVVFRWRDPASAAEIVVMYQKDYGVLGTLPGLAAALTFAHTGDNQGPSSEEAVLQCYQDLRQRFPGAQVVGSTLDAFARDLLAAQLDLPVVTGEIGDTWIHGVGTDPGKVSRFRELCRLRQEWLASGRARPAELNDFSRQLLMTPEHTWGLDEKTYLGDYTHYAAAAFHAVRRQPRWRAFEQSWAEQRAYLDGAIAALPPVLRSEAEARCFTLQPRALRKAAWRPVTEPKAQFETLHFRLQLAAGRGGLLSLIDGRTGREWVAPDQPWPLVGYQTFSAADYERFYRQYCVNKAQTESWSRPDLTKPGMENAGAESRWWPPRLSGLYTRSDAAGVRFLLELAAAPHSDTVYGCPRQFTLEMFLPTVEPTIEFTLQWFDKPACRLPEALWLSFTPRTLAGAAWQMEKLGSWISPGEVVRNGNRHLHAVGQGLTYTDRRGHLRLETLDAPLVAPGAPSLLDFNNRQPALKGGWHFNLYNNIWGTNFPMWYDEPARFRFILSF